MSWWWITERSHLIYLHAIKKSLTLCNPMNCSPPNSLVHGILQARILEWIAISFSRGSSWPRGEPGLLHCRQILYHLSQQGSWKYLKALLTSGFSFLGLLQGWSWVSWRPEPLLSSGFLLPSITRGHLPSTYLYSPSALSNLSASIFPRTPRGRKLELQDQGDRLPGKPWGWVISQSRALPAFSVNKLS